MRLLLRLLREQDAVTAVEYAVMLSLVLGAALSTIGLLGSQSGGMWGNIEGELRKIGFFGS
jgi:Flp pilus assembly pilin Flp